MGALTKMASLNIIKAKESTKKYIRKEPLTKRFALA
jgi:hypothetical protein